MRKSGIGPVSIYKIYYKVLSKYKDIPYGFKLAYKTTKIDEKYSELIGKFWDEYGEEKFNKQLTQVEDYFEFCFEQSYSIYFHNLGQYIDLWKKDRLTDSSSETKYLFAQKVLTYLKERNLTFKQYIEKQKNYIPIMLQHYLSSKEIPFEVILYLKVLDRVDMDKKKLKILLHREFIEMEKYKARAKKLNTLFEGEIKRIIS